MQKFAQEFSEFGTELTFCLFVQFLMRQLCYFRQLQLVSQSSGPGEAQLLIWKSYRLAPYLLNLVKNQLFYGGESSQYGLLSTSFYSVLPRSPLNPASLLFKDFFKNEFSQFVYCRGARVGFSSENLFTSEQKQEVSFIYLLYFIGIETSQKFFDPDDVNCYLNLSPFPKEDPFFCLIFQSQAPGPGIDSSILTYSTFQTYYLFFLFFLGVKSLFNNAPLDILSKFKDFLKTLEFIQLYLTANKFYYCFLSTESRSLVLRYSLLKFVASRNMGV